VSADKPLIVAHRGAAADAPENTAEAFKLAWEQNADAIEGDFHLTADGVLACHHDPVVKGNDREMYPINEYNFEALLAIAPTLLRLEDFLALIPQDKQAFIELKAGPDSVAPLLNVLGASEVPLERLNIITFDSAVLAQIKDDEPKLRTYLLSDRRLAPDRLLPLLKDLRADGYSPKAELPIGMGYAEKLREAGFSLHTWTVDDHKLAQKWSGLNANSITTNRPAWLREELGL